MPHYATITTACLAGLATGQMAFADPLLRRCGDGLFKTLRKSTFMYESVRRTSEIVNFDESTLRFGVLISPADDVSQQNARQMAWLDTDVVCMHFDSQVGDVATPVRKSDGWYVSTGCKGHWVRMEEAC
jgi:hypothetical protein